MLRAREARHYGVSKNGIKTRGIKMDVKIISVEMTFQNMAVLR